jgi:Bcr/CflA subfamily drug resistance transporter
VIKVQSKLTRVSPPLWLLFLLVGFPQLSETVYSPALPTIAHSLSAGNHLVQWTLSIYFVGFSLGVFIWGRLSDGWGRRPTMLAGLAVYAFASFLCLVSNNIMVLLMVRLVQGLGASSGSVLTQTMARESLHDQKRHRFFSSVGFVIAFSIALGPFVGGYLTQWFGWRANFGLLLVLAVGIMVCACVALPETRVQSQQQKSKVREVFLLLFKDSYFLACVWLVAVVNGILFSYFAEAPFIFIRLTHLSTSQYGWLGGLIAVASLLGGLASRRLVQNFSPVQIMVRGCAILLLSSVVLVVITFLLPSNLMHDSRYAVCVIMLPVMGLVFAGFGFLVPMALSTALQPYQSVLGTAGALFGLSYYLIIAFLTWVMGAIHNGTVYPMPVYFLILSVLSTAVCFFWIRRKR